MHGIFITGTSTGVGKTHVGVLLARALVDRGITVIPRKPVESGCARSGEALVPADAQALMQAARYQGDLVDVCPYRFQPPISPARAARIARQAVTTAQLAAACAHDRSDEFMLVEGAGGFYSPVAEDGLNADLAVSLQLPVLLVAENTLGVLNHVLLNVEAIKARGLHLVGVVLNTLDSNQDIHMDNAADLREQLDCAVHTQDFNAGRIDADLVSAIAARPTSAVA